MSKKVDGFAPGPRPICGFCNAPWTDDMIQVYDIDASHGEGSCDSRYSGGPAIGPYNQRATVDIHCEKCERLIYRKEHKG